MAQVPVQMERTLWKQQVLLYQPVSQKCATMQLFQSTNICVMHRLIHLISSRVCKLCSSLRQAILICIRCDLAAVRADLALM